jgi:hypothetical protein
VAKNKLPNEANEHYVEQVRKALYLFFTERKVPDEEIDARVHRTMVLHQVIEENTFAGARATPSNNDESALDDLGSLG